MQDTRTGNRLLDALSFEGLEELRPHLHPYELLLRHPLVERGHVVDQAYFPTEGLISLVSRMEDGSSVETAAIGPEGVMGIPALLDSGRTMVFDAMTQIPGHSLAMDAGVFLDRVRPEGRLRDLVEAYTHGLFVMIGQNAACNRLHSLSERTSRWLLMARDRAGGDVFPLTHEFLAQMLGVRRASVSEAAEEARAIGAIRYQRGVVTILDRAGLEKTACECYAISRDAFVGIYD
jgi:CRP-like cAMP-binding protein